VKKENFLVGLNIDKTHKNLQISALYYTWLVIGSQIKLSE